MASGAIGLAVVALLGCTKTSRRAKPDDTPVRVVGVDAESPDFRALLEKGRLGDAAMERPWMTVQGGVREGTGTGNLNAWPYQMMDALLGEYGVATTSSTDGKQEIPRDERIVNGHVGTTAAGYRWLEATSLETSMIPVRVEITAYGLDGIDLEWKFVLAQDGQYGFTDVRNRALRVRFATPEAAARFERAWQKAGGGQHQLVP